MNRSVLAVGAIIVIIVFGAIWATARKATPLSVVPASAVAGGNAEAGREHFRKYGCGSCHTIPGVRGAVGKVGPPLIDMRDRGYIAGMLSNTAENLMLWIQYPQQVQPGNAMPSMGVSEGDARDMTAYLYGVR